MRAWELLIYLSTLNINLYSLMQWCVLLLIMNNHRGKVTHRQYNHVLFTKVLPTYDYTCQFWLLEFTRSTMIIVDAAWNSSLFTVHICIINLWVYKINVRSTCLISKNRKITSPAISCMPEEVTVRHVHEVACHWPGRYHMTAMTSMHWTCSDSCTQKLCRSI